MICLLSQSFNEPTTEVVMSWLQHYGVPFIRLNGDDLIGAGGARVLFTGPATQSATHTATSLSAGGTEVDIETIKVVWFRRWGIANRYKSANIFRDQDDGHAFNIFSASSHLHSELKTLSEFLFSSLSNAAWLGKPENDLNKLNVLRLAASHGLDIPETLVTSKPADVRQFLEKHSTVITKPLSDMLVCVFDQRMAGSFTSVLSSAQGIEALWEGGFPSCFQECLDKQYELRIFYLDGECHSMAMFSQAHDDTRVDFRKYRYKDPTRCVPYQLDAITEARLGRLMKDLGLETGSIDMVRTAGGRLVFLEINPVGQFGMVSHPCNYFLEEHIASALVRRLMSQESNHGTTEQ